MKPITLQFAGINSYEQEFLIDFATLARGGIFGIFGPTGSGKSTILDAITLALFGEIPRYTKTPHRSFINSVCDAASVHFKFQIQQGPNCNVYEVMRGYKHNPKTKGASITFCRLQTAEGEILADRKESLVNAAIIKLVGLNYHDFTRSVFLPQGKFNEFLFLKGDERSKMLERLFDLERFGKALQERVKAAALETKNKLDACLLQISFYGDITPAGLEDKQQSLAQLSDKIKHLEATRGLYMQDWEKYRALEALYKQLVAIKQEHEQHKKFEDEIKTDSRALEAARRAAGLRPPLENLSSLTVLFAQAQTNYTTCENFAAHQQSEAEKHNTAHQAARKAMEEEYPALLKQQHDLTANLAILNEIEALETERAALRQDWKALNDELETLTKTQDRLRQNEHQATRALEEIAEKKAGLEVSAQTLKTLHEGAGIEAALQTKAAEIAAKKIALEKSQVQAQTLLASLESKALMLTEQKAQMQQNHAAGLALTLQSGQPCPVCGATHHPSPAIGQAHFVQDEQIEKLAKEIEACKLKHAQSQAKIEDLTKSLQEMTTEHQNLAHALASLKQTLPIQTNFAPALEEAFNKNTARAKLEKEEAGLRANGEGLANELQTLGQQTAHLKSGLDNITAKGTEKAEAIAAKRASLGAYGNLEKLQEVINQVKTRITDITAGAKDSEALKNKHQAALQEAAANLAQARERLKNTGELLTNQQEQIAQALELCGFESQACAEAAILTEPEIDALDSKITRHHQKSAELERSLSQLAHALKDEAEPAKIPDKQQHAHLNYQNADKALIQARETHAVLQDEIEKMTASLEVLNKLAQEKKALEARHGTILQIDQLFRGNAFIKFLAARHLHYITHEATARLRRMTGGQYAIEYDEDTNFLIRDDFNGGTYRPPASLSGGEVFMTSLCLALALSTKIQMKNHAQLSLFFLDEGFGSLDRQTLDHVVDCLERLQEENMVVGLITHVEELKHRIANKIELG